MAQFLCFTACACPILTEVNSKLVPHSRNQLQGRTRHPEPPHHMSRAFHPGAQGHGPASVVGEEHGQDDSTCDPEAGGCVALGAVGEAEGGERVDLGVVEG